MLCIQEYVYRVITSRSLCSSWSLFVEFAGSPNPPSLLGFLDFCYVLIDTSNGITMPDRAGYTLVVYAIDTSPSMGDAKPDPGSSGAPKRSKLDLAKEFVARQCEPKVGQFSFTCLRTADEYIDIKWEEDGSRGDFEFWG